MLTLNTEKLRRLPVEKQVDTLNRLWERHPDEHEALRLEAKELGLVRQLNGTSFESATKRASPGSILGTVPDGARPALSIAELAETVRTHSPHLFLLELPDGQQQLLAGTPSSATDRAGQEVLSFASFDHKAALPFTGPGLSLHIATRKQLELNGSPHIKVLKAIKCSELPAHASPPLRQRFHLGKEARQLRDEGVRPRVDLAMQQRALRDPVMGHSPGGRWRSPSPELRADIKLEKNALAAVLIDHAVRQSYDALVTTDFRQQLEAEKSQGFRRSAYDCLGMLIRTHVVDALHAADSDVTQPITRARQRLDDVLAFMTANYMPVIGRTAMKLVESGVQTAETTITGLASVIPSLYEQTHGSLPDAEQAAAIFANSRKLIRDFANADLEIFGRCGSLPFIQYGPSVEFNPEKFELVGEGKAQRVQLKPEAKLELEREIGASLETTLQATTGCPALTQMGGRTALDKIVDAAEKMLPEVYSVIGLQPSSVS